MSLSRTPATKTAFPLASKSSLPPRSQLLATMLTYKRPHNSRTEVEFINRFLVPLELQKDTFGNLWKIIPLASGQPSPILWSSHTDTVHASPGRNKIWVDHNELFTKHSSCLGGDCTTGVWIMKHMIKAGVPGTYIFHRGEERGGLGSRWLAETHPEWFVGIDFAIAFDRKGYSDIITKQSGVCCSEDFASLLAEALLPLKFSACPDGIFTDTANYTGLVSECTNLSVGYHHAHTSDETQDWAFAEKLLDQILNADFTKLLAFRDPLAKESWNYGDWESDDLQIKWNSKSTTALTSPTVLGPASPYKALSDYVYTHPHATTQFLMSKGFTKDSIEQHAVQTYLDLALEDLESDSESDH